MSKNKGWIKLFGDQKWHYFGEDRRSLCHKRMIFTVPEDADDKHDHPDNCAECKRVLAKG